MDNLNIEIKNKILDLLKTTKIGASSSEISKKIGHNRVTVTKYLEIMKAHKILDFEGVAQAKLWYISKRREKPTILIVDDEPNVVDLVALSLIPDKYNIIKAYSGLDALDKVYKDTPDIIILDLMMPGINGYEICQKLKENAITQHIPIIILSAKGELEDKLHGLKIGADDYMTKPFDPMELEARVERTIRKTNQDQDMHPITKLPGIIGLKQEIQSILNSEREDKEFFIFNFTIKNLNAYNKKYGYKKGDHAILLISRVFSDSLTGTDNFFIAHTLKDNFVIINKNKNFVKKTIDLFNRIVPYLLKENDKLKLSFNIKEISSKEIISKNINIETILKKLEVY